MHNLPFEKVMKWFISIGNQNSHSHFMILLHNLLPELKKKRHFKT